MWCAFLIDAGTNMSWMWTATDLDGNPRITDGIVDMGAYEYIPEPSFYLSFVVLDYGLFIPDALRGRDLRHCYDIY